MAAARRSAEEVQHLLTEYRQSGLTRAEYCRRQGIPVTTLDYYLHRQARKAKPRLARVTVTPEGQTPVETFTLVVRNGRRIESGWNFRDADLARLVRIAEAE